MIASLGAPIGKARLEIVEKLSHVAAGILEDLKVPHFDISLEYQVDPKERDIICALEDSLARDRIRGRTSLGPHTDDLVIAKREGRAREVASRGEARALTVALRLSERQVLGECATSVPLLLLDDVAAELDRVRAAKVIEMVENQEGQVVVTATGDAEQGFGSGWRHFEIRDGVIGKI
jgi:DNA replication and repair protein RecF